jgi:hypothetical protein
LSEVGNPEISSVSTERLDQNTDAVVVTAQTEIGEVRYIKLNEKKLGVQFQFADRSGNNSRAMPEKYRALPSDADTYLLLGNEGRLHLIREASASERRRLAEVTSVGSRDALMHYHSKYGGFIVEPKRDEVRGSAEQRSNPLLVTVGDGQKPRDLSYTDGADYLIDEDWTANTEPEVARFERSISGVEIRDESSVSTIEVPEATAESSDFSASSHDGDGDHNYDCSKDWAGMCAGSVVGCLGCAGICSTSMSGVTLVACLGCVGSVCNFSIPLSCSIFLDCW